MTKNVDARMVNLSRATGVPDQFVAVGLKEAPCIEIAEEVVHYLLREYQVENKSKDFFRISVDQAKKVSEYVIKTPFETKLMKPKYLKEQSNWQIKA